MDFDVSVVGLYILDILGRPVERIPDKGNVEFIDQIRLTVAGTAGGTVVDCAKLGLKARAVGAVGNDEKADFVLATLQGFGIDTELMQRLPEVPTSATILNIRPNGDRPALHVRGASDHFDVTPEMDDAVLAPPFVHVGGTGLLRRMDGEPTRRLLAAAKQRGRTTTFDLIAATAETLGIVEPLSGSGCRPSTSRWSTPPAAAMRTTPVSWPACTPASTWRPVPASQPRRRAWWRPAWARMPVSSASKTRWRR